MQIKHATQFFYLSGEIIPELHDERYCSCPQPQTQPHTVYEVQCFELDVPGLQALDVALLGDNKDDFAKWLENHPAKTYYGSDKQRAVLEAIKQTRLEGKLLINHPEAFPWIVPVVSALTSVVGDGQFDQYGCLGKEYCKCSSIHTSMEMLCRACYARLVSKIINTYIVAYLRQS